MRPSAATKGRWLLIAAPGLLAGCAGLAKSDPRPLFVASHAGSFTTRNDAAQEPKSKLQERPVVQPVSAVDEKAAGQQIVAPDLHELKELMPETLVDNVLARNPSVVQMTAAWEAATARVPQVTSLDDPIAGATLAPAALGMNPAGFRVELSQRVPYPGKLALRGEVAQAEASAASRDVEGIRQQLIEAARDAYYEYYLTARSAEVNDEVLRSLRMSRSAAESLFTTGRGKQQDVLVLDVELSRRKNRTILLERQKAVAVARINALLHQPPDTSLPPPPKSIKVEGDQMDVRKLQAQALSQRLDLLAVQDRITGAHAALDLAQKEYYPDFDLMAAYDNMWDDAKMRPQVGIRINLPFRLAKRDGAVAEAQARLAELHAQLARQQDQAAFEVQQAYEQWRESHRTVRLFETETLPAARLSVKAAQAGYVPGDVPLLVLLEAQRNLADLQDQYYQATADVFRRRAVLQRTLIGPSATGQLPMPAERPSPGQSGSSASPSSRM